MRQPGQFGQLCWDTYTVVVLGFHLPSGLSNEAVTKELDRAAIKLLNAYPVLSGKVIAEGRTSTTSGVYKTVPYAPHSNGKSPVRAKDCSQLCPSYQKIVQADAPFSMLDGEILCPARGMGYIYGTDVESPVLIIQANYVAGGLLLCFASQHNVLDMNGQGIMIRQFAALLRGEELDSQVVKDGNADVSVPLLKEGEMPLTHDEFRKPSSLGPKSTDLSSNLPPMRWVYWRIPSEKLVQLKNLATHNSTSKVSTNDTITAFWTQRLTIGRIKAGRLSPDEPLHCGRAVNVRAKVIPPVPETYLGHFVYVANNEWNVSSKVSESPLSKVASDLRSSLDSIDDHAVRSFLTLLHNTEDKTTLFYGGNLMPGKDILISSWAQMDLAKTCSFGSALGGKPDFVRRANMDLVPNLTYIMPMDREGNMDLGSCMSDLDIEALQADEVWDSYTRLIG